MVTNLKRSKKIRAFCYRMFAVAALVTAIGSAILGREALVNAYRVGVSQSMLGGDKYWLCDFREYVAKMYTKAMVGYAGIGDDKGYPLTDAYAKEYSKQALTEFDRMVRAANGDVVYYVKTAEGQEYSNVSFPLFSEYDGHMLLPEAVQLCCYWNGAGEVLQFFEHESRGVAGDEPYEKYYLAQYKANREVAADMQLVIAVKNDCTSGILQGMEFKAQQYVYVLLVIGISFTLFLLFAILGLFSGRAARAAKEEYAEVSVKVWLEGKLLLAVAIIYLGCLYNLEGFAFSLEARMHAYDVLWMYFPISCILYLLYIDIRQNGRRTFENSLPVKVFRYIKEAAYAMPWYRKMLVFDGLLLVGACAMLFWGICMIANSVVRFQHTAGLSWLQQTFFRSGVLFVIFGLLCMLGFLYLRFFLNDVNKVVNKLSEMRRGRGRGALKLSNRSLLRDAAEDLNELEAGIEKAVEEQSRSNKMKVELITNVSHDLKTPLTSIINYADLLCEEELPDAAMDYAVALQRKAYRLKTMVQDVFDLSKATSGNLAVEKAVIDLAKLIKQTLADMDEKIQESDLAFKLNIATEPLPIEADGEKLYRVFQNLFVNALQYSLEHSRVYVQLTEENGWAVVRIKNTSRLELDFDTDEIVERFVRADSSRTTEGSGLGLSIVQSFVEACGGQFMIETDADMFTACVKFPLLMQ